MKEIAKGIKNHLVNGDTLDSEAKMKICNVCPEMYKDVLFGKRCNKCGCVLKFKVKSDSECPLGKW